MNPNGKDLVPAVPTHVAPFTNHEFAYANGWTVDAAEKYLRRRWEGGEYVRERRAIFDPETKHRYWTFVYQPNPEYVSAVSLTRRQMSVGVLRWCRSKVL